MIGRGMAGLVRPVWARQSAARLARQAMLGMVPQGGVWPHMAWRVEAGVACKVRTGRVILGWARHGQAGCGRAGGTALGVLRRVQVNRVLARQAWSALVAFGWSRPDQVRRGRRDRLGARPMAWTAGDARFGEHWSEWVRRGQAGKVGPSWSDGVQRGALSYGLAGQARWVCQGTARRARLAGFGAAGAVSGGVPGRCGSSHGMEWQAEIGSARRSGDGMAGEVLHERRGTVEHGGAGHGMAGWVRCVA